MDAMSKISKTYKELLNYDVGAINKLSSYGRRFLNQKSLEKSILEKISVEGKKVMLVPVRKLPS